MILRQIGDCDESAAINDDATPGRTFIDGIEFAVKLDRRNDIVKNLVCRTVLVLPESGFVR